MKILITGALGHIGSELIRKLPSSLDISKLILIDNFSTQRFCSLFNIKNKKKIILIEDDIRKVNLEKILEKVDIVIHLAAITDAAKSFSISEEVEENNFQTTKLIADNALNTNTKLITLSSTSVYGTSKSVVDENCLVNDLNPQSPYAKTKLKEEDYVLRLSKNKNLKSVILRFGTIFGISPGMRFHTAVNKFCWQASWNQPLTVWSTAYEQVRPYLDLKDACNAISHIIKSNLFNGEIYNVLTLNASVKKVIDEIKKHKKDLFIKKVESKIMNQLSYNVSTEKFLKTGFKYEGSLEKGIEETLSLLNN